MAGRGKRANTANGPAAAGVLNRLIWLGFAAVWLFVAASLLTFSVGDAPSHVVYPHHASTHNLMGPAGALTAYAMLSLLGWGVAPLMAGAGLTLGMAAAGHALRHPIVRTVGILVLSIATAGLAGSIAPAATLPMPRLAGGAVGVVIAGELVPRFAVAGATLWMLLAVVVGMIVAFDRLAFTGAAWTARAAVRAGRWAATWTGRALHAGAANAASRAKDLAEARAARRAAVPRETDIDETVIEVKPGQGRKKKPKPEPAISEGAGGLGGVEAFDPAEHEAASAAPSAQDDADASTEEDEDADDTADEASTPDDDDDDVAGAPQVFDRDKLKAKIAALPLRFASNEKHAATDEDLAGYQNPATLAGYKFPGMDLLEEPDEGFGAELEAYVREQAEALENALKQYRIEGEVVGIESGPVITLYHVALAPGTKVAALNAVSSDLARSLKSINIRVVPNMVGRDTIGIEVPNAKKEKVRLKELMADRARFEGMKLPMFLGKDASGDPLIADLTKMPHMLIAGTTGSGKSVCMNTIVMSFLYTKKPNELKLVLVDPKMVEMSQFKDIPHLMCPVVTEMSKAAAILEWAVGKMDERYELLAEAGCRDIASYNDLPEDELLERFRPAGGPELSENEKARIPRKLPYMVFIIDELADLMMTNKEVEGSIVRIAQKARAVGIHLILATQRPQANVVTGLIKGNMPCRITFKVASGLDSRIVLDQKGGELLLGQGDMLFLSPSSHKLMRSQGTLVDDKEIRRVVRFLKEVAAPSFERSLVQLRTGISEDDAQRLGATENNSSASLAAAQEDPLFDRSVEIVLETKRGSVSLLQRRLAIGYTRASRLIDLMGIAGIIGEHKGSVAREVLITPEEWEAIKAMAAEMAAAQGITLPAPGSHPEDVEQPELFADVAARGTAPVGDAAADEAEEEASEEDEPEEDDEYEYVEVDEDEELDPDAEYEYVEVDEEDEEEADEEAEAEGEDEEPDEGAPFTPTDRRRGR